MNFSAHPKHSMVYPLLTKEILKKLNKFTLLVFLANSTKDEITLL